MKQIITIIFFLCLCISLKAYSLSSQPAASMGISGNVFDGQPSLQPGLTVGSSERLGKPGFQVKVYPNPATDFIRVEWGTDIQTEVHVELYDLVGRRVARERSDNQVNHIRINMEPFQKSAYLLKIYTTDGEYSRTFRIIKN